MALTAAFRWDVGAKEITYMVHDLSNLRRRVQLTRHAVTTQQAAYNAILQFQTDLNALNAKGAVEYLILNTNAPWQTQQNPSQLSVYIKTTFDNAVGSLPGWTRASQMKRELKKPELTKFKSGLRDLQLLSARPKACEWHLWSVLLHATKGTHRKDLQKLWQAVKGISAKTKVGKQQFQAWYAQL